MTRIPPAQIVVLGMHRSGTSAVTRSLNLAGAWFGPDDIATEANEENPRGFWERRDVREVCDGLLHDGGHDWWRLDGFDASELDPDSLRCWSEVFSDTVAAMDPHRPWVMKEPRLCVLLPALLPLLDAPVAVHVSREPLEVARSLHRRNGFSVQAGLALWERYTLSALSATQGLPRVLVRYEDLMADPSGTTARLLADLADVGVEGLEPVPPSTVEEFISRDLHRHREDRDARGGWLNREQEELLGWLDDGSILERPPPPMSAGATQELVELEHRVALSSELERQTSRLEADLAAQSRYRETELARRRELGRQADDALATVDVQLERIDRSRIGRAARGLISLRQHLSPGTARVRVGLVDHVRQEVAERRTDIEARAHQDPAPGGASDTTFATGNPLVRRTRPGARGPTGDRPSVAVVAWDVGHNPLGRANVLAEVLDRRFDVELWGAQFDRYGSQVWAPLRGAATPVNVFPGGPFPGQLATMGEVAREIDADAIWVSKPRLPSYLLGILAKQAQNRPLVLDVDDHELAFFDVDRGLDLDELRAHPPSDLVWPFERQWTQLCDGFIDAADQVTVSNVALQQRYGGLLVPHARDERRFDPARYDRAEVRDRLGVGPDERLLLFGGTPRAHKGVVEVLEALERLKDDRYRLLVFGTREFDQLRPQIGDLARWARVLPAQSFDDLPELVLAADLACVIQDPGHPVSRYQMPAKVSDALAMGVPCLVTPTPPLAPLVEEGVLQVLEPGDLLHERIDRVFADPGEARARARRGREVFLRDLSYEAVAEVVAPVFEHLLGAPPPVSTRLSELADEPARVFAGAPGVPPVRRHPVRVPRRRDPEAAPVAPGSTFDVVMFWKQNDSGLYGRRQDMFLEELARSRRVGTIVHFDNPISPETLVQGYREGFRRPADQRRLVARETLARSLHRRDEADVHRHTFLFGARYTRRLGRPPRSAYVDHVQAVLARHDVGARPVIVWGYPSNDDLPDLIDALAPEVVVSDVVDDNRTWYEAGSPHVARIERSYEEVLGRSDLVLANCTPVAEAMARFADEVHVVPNGCELTRVAPGPRPAVLQGLEGPVVAYVGNLSARLDTELIVEVARARPEWNLVLIGSAHLDDSALALDRLPNVHFPGVLPYPEVRRLLAHVDVGLIPHVDNEMTRSMNPLKAFVYVSAGVPVVSTPVANLADLDGWITVASDASGFVSAIDAHLAAGRRPPDVELLRPHSWERRVEQVFAALDHELSRS